jgi:hypothetical protein
MTIRIFSDAATFKRAGQDWDCIFPKLSLDTVRKHSGSGFPKPAMDLLQDGDGVACRFMTASTSDPAWGALQAALENALLEMRKIGPNQPGSVVIAIPGTAPGDGGA